MKSPFVGAFIDNSLAHNTQALLVWRQENRVSQGEFEAIGSRGTATSTQSVYYWPITQTNNRVLAEA